MNFNGNSRRVRKLLLSGFYLILIGLAILSRKYPETAIPVSITYAKVTRVFDGDTIQISTGEKVRYIGIDSSEVYPIKECFSEEEKLENEKLVLGKEVRVEKDMSETDKYGRLLRYVFVGDVFVNDYLVRNGFAKALAIQPDMKYKEKLSESERAAKESKLGLWGKCL